MNKKWLLLIGFAALSWTIQACDDSSSGAASDPCDPNPCVEEHRTVCVDQDGTAVCQCDEGYTEDASGNARLTGKGLELKVQMGGNRSTSAIDSLKVVAFDLAALCLSMEGKTQVPAFLIHDSPREADLGLSLYERLFHFVHDLEGVTETPAFQYIITTTTRPPESLAKKPWLTTTLSGSPASERLLKRDL